MKNAKWTLFVIACLLSVSTHTGFSHKDAQYESMSANFDTGIDQFSAIPLAASEPSKIKQEPQSFAALSGDEPSEPGHDLGSIKGTNIDMKVYDHAIAGAIKGFVAWGFFDESSGISTLIMRHYAQLITTEFKKQEDGKFGGVIKSGEGDAARITTVRFVKVDPSTHSLVLELNGNSITVNITSEAYENGHFINPTYSTVINGEAVSYKIEGEGCYGYSIHMAMMILGAYVH
ncbi:hypothetical protein ACFL6Y_07820 [Elusimicrobiota bacterium]